MESRSISFFSEGVRLAGDLFLPGDLKHGETRAGIVLCHGYTGVRNLYLPDIARVLTEAGYVVLTFDYKGWGDSEGPKSRLAPYSRVIDVQAALTWLGAQDMVDAERLGIYGTSYGGATVVWVAAVDPRVKCVVSVVGVGNGQRWMRSVRRPDEYHDLLERSAADRVRRATEGHSEFVERTDILIPDRQSAELAAAARRGNPGAVSEIPLEFVDDTLGFNAEWVVDRIAPRPVLFITIGQRPAGAAGGKRGDVPARGGAEEAGDAARVRALRGLHRRGVPPGDGANCCLVPAVLAAAKALTLPGRRLLERFQHGQRGMMGFAALYPSYAECEP